MNPEPVSRQQIGNLPDGQRHLSTLDAHVHLGSSQIEDRPIGAQPARNQNQQQAYGQAENQTAIQQETQPATHVFHCTKVTAH